MLSNREDYFNEDIQDNYKSSSYRHSSASQHDLWSHEVAGFLDSPADENPRIAYPAFRNRLSPPTRASSTPPFQLQTGPSHSQFTAPHRETAYNDMFNSLNGLSLDDERPRVSLTFTSS